MTLAQPYAACFRASASDVERACTVTNSLIGEGGIVAPKDAGDFAARRFAHEAAIAEWVAPRPLREVLYVCAVRFKLTPVGLEILAATCSGVRRSALPSRVRKKDNAIEYHIRKVLAATGHEHVNDVALAVFGLATKPTEYLDPAET